MSEKLIMPKQTGKLEPFYASLKIYYDNRNQDNGWVSNDIYKKKICEYVNELHEGDDSPKLVKQSELTRYFGLVEYDYGTSIGRARITDRGLKFYQQYINNDIGGEIDTILYSILHDSFGRNNTAIKSSNSDVDAPKLFLKAILDLNGITRKDLAYLLFITHDLKIEYRDAITELSKRNDDEREIPISVSNKYNDVKFTVFLENLNICYKKNNKYYISYHIVEKYENELKQISIYNTIPDIILTMNEEDETQISNEDDDNINQESITRAFGYDLISTKFYLQNNRKPILQQNGRYIRYKTNPRISKTALNMQGNECCIDCGHKTFVSKTGVQYMEAHHLIPMHAQRDFKENLDRIENIFSLCPICHSAIHLGNQATRMDVLKKLYDKAEISLKKVGLMISFGEIFSKYYN